MWKNVQMARMFVHSNWNGPTWWKPKGNKTTGCWINLWYECLCNGTINPLLCIHFFLLLSTDTEQNLLMHCVDSTAKCQRAKVDEQKLQSTMKNNILQLQLWRIVEKNDEYRPNPLALHVYVPLVDSVSTHTQTQESHNDSVIFLLCRNKQK